MQYFSALSVNKSPRDTETSHTPPDGESKSTQDTSHTHTSTTGFTNLASLNMTPPKPIPIPTLHRSSSKGSSQCNENVHWNEHGYEKLPNDPAFELKIGSCPAELDTSLVAAWEAEAVHTDIRDIPENSPFSLSWAGTTPAPQSFEMKEVAPALIQAGHYTLSVTWLAAERGAYVDVQALKMLHVEIPNSVIEAHESNHVTFTKGHGLAKITATKQKWFQRQRDERWVLSYNPGHHRRHQGHHSHHKHHENHADHHEHFHGQSAPDRYDGESSSEPNVL